MRDARGRLMVMYRGDLTEVTVGRTELEMMVGKDPFVLDPEYATGIWDGV